MSDIKSKVVMLPSNKMAAIVQESFLGNKRLVLGRTLNIGDMGYHLYFTSDEYIKECDWCYHPELSQEYSIVTKEGIKTGLHPAQGVFRWKSTTNPWYKKAKKIIATTDKSLRLPKPLKGFLDVYVKAYNEGKKIEEVLIQCNEKGLILHGRGGERTITIKKVKDSWNRKEVIHLLDDLAYELSPLGGRNEYSKIRNVWIEQNL